MIKHCKHCGKLFETNHPKKIFCSVKCRGRYYYISDLLKLEEEARQAEQKREKIKPVPPSAVPAPNPKGQIAKLWDPNDPECIETMAFIRTIKPLDFSGLNAEIEEELRKTNVANKGHYKTLPELRSGV